MRTAARTKGLRSQVAGSASIPSPVGGWNARDALGEMEATDAVYMENFFPATSDVILRYGYSQFATGFSGQVETLITYSGGSSNKLLAICGGSIYNITSGGAIPAASVSGLTNSRFQYINIATSGGNFLMAVNGADKLRYFDGTTHSADGGTYTITGVDTRSVSQICLHKTRVWLIENASLNVWYLPTNSIQGAATSFSLQAVARQGGYVVAMGTWTIDAGAGVDDYAVFVTNNGEVIVYQGTDPSSATTWALKGVWALGSPVGRRCLMKYAGDLLMICQDGILPLAGALQSSRVNPRVALSDKIQWAVSQAVTNYGANFGWETLYFPKENMLFLNVPVTEGTDQQQFVMNTITRAWCNFTGWEANCWTLFNDAPYFGGNGVVCKAWDTNADNATNIQGDCKQAFNYFQSPAQIKQWTMMRPLMLSDGLPAILATLNIDFEDQPATTPLTFSASSYATWDSATWDTSIWAGGLSPIRQWQGTSGIGYCAAPRVTVLAKNIKVQWVSTDLVMQKGSIL